MSVVTGSMMRSFSIGVIPRRMQPVLEAAGAACKAVRSEQDEGNGRENGEKCPENAESEAEKSEDGEKDFFQDHGVVFLSMK